MHSLGGKIYFLAPFSRRWLVVVVCALDVWKSSHLLSQTDKKFVSSLSFGAVLQNRHTEDCSISLVGEVTLK